MIEGAVKCALEYHARHGLSGIIGVGGSMGTALGTVVMGVPVRPAQGDGVDDGIGLHQAVHRRQDINMFNPVCDIAGLNRITRDVSAMLRSSLQRWRRPLPVCIEPKPLTATTMSAQSIVAPSTWQGAGAQGYEVMVFHTLGTGGMAMDQIVRERDVAAVVDVSLVEINDYLNNGMCSAGPDRAKAALEKGCR